MDISRCIRCWLNVILTFLSLVSLVLTANDFSITFECPAGWKLIGTHCYNFINTELDFYDSFDVCKKYGATLLQVRDEVEAKNISLEAKSLFSQDHYWISNGYNESEPSGDSFDRLKCDGYWQINEPSDLAGKVAAASDKFGRWAVKSVWINLPFVCRAPACPTDTFRCSNGICLNHIWKCDKVFDCSDASDENNCTDCNKYYKNSTGTINSSNEFNCQWVIEGEPGEVLRVVFETVNVKENLATVFVFSGGPTIGTSHLIKELKVSTSEKTSLYGINHFLIIKLHSFGSTTKPSIKANWMPDDQLSKTQVEKINVSDGSWKTISTPHFGSNNLPSTYKKKWIISSDIDTFITVEIEDNTLDLNNTSNFMISPVSFSLHEPNSNKAIYISNSSTLTITAIADNQLNKWMMAKIWKGCNFNTTLTMAIIELSGGLLNQACHWIIRSKPETDFSMMLTGVQFHYSSDLLEVYNSTDVAVGKLVYEAGNSVDGNKSLFNLDGAVTILYKSNSSGVLAKFKAKLAAECVSIPDTSNMIILESVNKIAGERYMVNISCNEGFAFLHEEYNYTATLQVVCEEDGTWNWGSKSYTRYPKCQVVYCGVPPAIRNGFIAQLENVTYGSKVSYSCYEGFQMEGQNESICQHYGTWSSPGSCEAEKCEGLLNISDGYFEPNSSMSFGTIVKFFCNDGYDLIGSEQIVCQFGKIWSDDPPKCKKLTCNLPKVQQGYYSTSNYTIEYNESVTLHCYSGFKNMRTNITTATLQCKSNRELSNIDSCVDINECEDNPCTKPNMECNNVNGSFDCICKHGYHMNGSECIDIDECANSSFNCDHICTNLNGSYECSCENGFVLFTKNGTNEFFFPNDEDGTKPGHIYYVNHTCVPELCEPPPMPTNGTVLSKKNKFHYNETVQFKCDFGFELIGSSLAYCSSDGNWTFLESGSSPKCRMLTCPVPEPSKLELAREPQGVQYLKPGESMTITCEQQCENCGNISKTLHCAPDMSGSGFTLQGDNPQCFAVNCSNIPWREMPGVVNKEMNCTTYGCSFEFECDVEKGFKVIGNSSLGNTTVICSRNGRWGFNSLTCQGSSCGDPGTLAGTEQKIQHSYEVGQSVQYVCKRPGFNIITNDTLYCKYINGTVTWSGQAPFCEDTEKPNITACPSLPQFNLYDPLIYELPSATDNSGYACLVLDSGPPSGVSVVSKNMTLTFKAFDLANNTKFISCDVVLKEQTRPWIECPGTIDYDMGANVSELRSVHELRPNISHSSDGNITFDPPEINFTIGSIYTVYASIMKSNGYSERCGFLIRSISKTCTNATIKPPNNGEIKECTGTNTTMTCSAHCKPGYTYQDFTDVKSYTCIDGNWSSQVPLLPCLKMESTVYKYKMDVTYLLNGTLQSSTNYTPCFESHEDYLNGLVKNQTFCNLTVYNIEHEKTAEIGIEQVSSIFSLLLYTNGVDNSSLQQCVTHLKNSSYFGPTYPNHSAVNCLPPWIKEAILEVTPVDWSCTKGGYKINTTFCMVCGPGYFLINGNCTECQDGTFQDKSGQTQCENCYGKKSYFPRTNRKHCYDVCPEGFSSSSGYTIDNCTQCKPYTYSSDNRTVCIPCTTSTQNSLCSAKCSNGHYSSSGYEPCKPCPMHFYSVNGTNCLECPNNTYTLNNGSANFKDCRTDDPDFSERCSKFCFSDGTLPNTNCMVIDHRMVCSCKKGYHGDSCNDVCDFCLSQPCFNEGQCTQEGPNITCDCKSEKNCTFLEFRTLEFTQDATFVTRNDTITPSECKDRCLKNDTCKAYLIEKTKKICFMYHKLKIDVKENIHESYIKNCSDKEVLFNGSQCEIDLVNNCDENICSDKDFCRDLLNATQCVCPHGQNSNPDCSKNENLCSSNPCFHGDCLHFGTIRYICSCHPGYTGHDCNVDVDECSMNPSGCLYNGTCNNNINSYNCSCKSKYYGEHCEQRPHLCAGNNCSENDGGLCVEDFHNLNYSCICGEFYSLSSDNQQCMATDFCQPSPCKNGGTCLREDRGFSCNCMDEFEGSLCQIKKETKQNETVCENVDACESEMKGYFCNLCPSSNTSCPSCLSKCRNYSNLTQTERQLCQCHCPESSTDNKCILYEPCLHGGICTNYSDDYNCSCQLGWTGKNCNNPKDYCSENNNTCQNSANCHNLINGTFCQCQNGTNGVKCENKTDICKDYGQSLCGLGTCKPDGGSAECICQSHSAGKSCELLRNLCSEDHCNGGICILNGTNFYCNCEAPKHVIGDFCNASSNMCDTCPSTNCITYPDKDDIQQSACLCPADRIHSEGSCAVVEKDFDLVFTKEFASKKLGLMSLRGFSLENVHSMTVTMWLAAAKDLDGSEVILSLNGAQEGHFFSILNSKIKFNSTSVELKSGGNTYKLDSENNWHFISVTWSSNGSYTIYLDYLRLHDGSTNDSLPGMRFVLVQLGQGFYGSISHVQIWKSELLFQEIFNLYKNKSYVPQPSNLLLGWTSYSFDEEVFMSIPSLAQKETSICDNRALMPFDLCQNSDDREPPSVIGICHSSTLIQTNYSQHQVSSSQLGYSFTDNVNRIINLTKLQFFSHGAYDIAVAANDSSGNIGVCMTRTYITQNHCEATKPGYFIDSCGNFSGVKVSCPIGNMPSIQTPKVLTCGQLRSFNLNNMYERPDMIVCGKISLPHVTLTINLEYSLQLCSGSGNINNVVNSSIVKLNEKWSGICEPSQCSNIQYNHSCINTLLSVEIQMKNIWERLNSSDGSEPPVKALDIMKQALHDWNTFNGSEIHNIALAYLRNGTIVGNYFSCPDGKVLIEHFCVECGEGSYYNNSSKTCDLCPFNSYTNHSKQTSCINCPLGYVTLQSGSSNFSDCVVKCTVGHMLNLTSNVCVPCPRNFYQDQPGKHYCFPCPPTFGTNNTGSINCTAFCPPGTQLNSSNQCEPCPRGSFRIGSQQDQCTKCPADFTTIDVGHDTAEDCKIPICQPGTFANTTDGKNYTCTPCKIGFYQPGNASVECFSCDQNYTTNTTGAFSKDECLFYCEAGYEENPPNSMTCTPCMRGFYRSNDDDNRFKNCSSCSSDNTTDSDKSVSQADCKLKRCGPGYNLSVDLSSCWPCPYDTYQPDDLPTSSTQCCACSEDMGTVNKASNSSSDCKYICSAGYGNTGSNCIECLQGFWNNGNISMRFEACHKCPENYTTEGKGAKDIKNCSLRACPAGTKINGKDCEYCSIGTYQPLPYQTFCNVCRENTSTSSVGSTSSEDCTILCPAGTEGNLTDHCVLCGDDEYKNVLGFGQCLNCTGDYTSSPSNRTHCTQVHCDFGREYKNNSCRDCLLGFYKSARGNDGCTKCPANKTTTLPASISIENCNITFCEPGFFSNDSTTCFACPIGTYKNESGNQFCRNCPQGITTVGAASTHEANCSRILCSAGYYRVNDSYCSSCPIGEYQNEKDQTECKKCEVLNNRPSTTFNTTSIDMRDCFPICEAGYFLNIPERSCLACPYGTYKNTTDLSVTCNKCPINVTTGIIAATSSSDCRFSICNKGHYIPNSANNSCEKCPIGTYKNVSSAQQSDCFQCPDNKTTLVKGATSQEKYCIPNCPEGQQFSLTEYNCTACSVGQYRENSTVLNVCKYCPTNQTTLRPGATTCIQSFAPVQSDIKMNITVYINISIANCANTDHLRFTIHNLTIEIIKSGRQEYYLGLCPTKDCGNLIYTLLDICGKTRKKRQASDFAHVKIVFYDISSSLTNSDGNRINTVEAVMKLFTYGTLFKEYDMDLNGLALFFDRIEVMCPLGYIYGKEHKMCILCSNGHFVNGGMCDPCPRGTYSVNPGSFCVRCPYDQTTDKNGSVSQSECKGLCYFNNSYCGNNGQCLIISDVHQCKCNDAYIGQQCAQRLNLENSNTIEIVAGVCSALGAILLIVVIVFGICIYRNKRRRSKRSTSSDTDVLSQGVPQFNYPIMFENPAMAYDPTMYNAEAVDFYSPEPSISGINKSSKMFNERWTWIEN